MFTRQDLITYLSDIELIEINMRDIYTEALKHIEVPNIVQKFTFLAKAEERHRELVSDLKKEVMALSITED